MSLSNVPRNQTLLRLERAKAFQLKVLIKNQGGEPYDLTGCTLLLAVSPREPRGAPTPLIEEFAELEPLEGFGWFVLTPLSLDLDPTIYNWALVLETADKYSAVIAKGELEIEDNADAYLWDTPTGLSQPPQGLSVTLRGMNVVSVNTEHLPVPRLQLGMVEHLPPGSVPYADLQGTYPSQTLALGLPEGDKGEKGDTGETGAVMPALDIAIDETYTLEPHQSAFVSLSGTYPQKQMKLYLPKGRPGIETVLHGTDASASRPNAEVVHWVGSAQPSNADPYDFWSKVNL